MTFVCDRLQVPSLNSDNSTTGGEITVPIWVLALGASGIVVGLATYGYNVIRTIGVHVSAL